MTLWLPRHSRVSVPIGRNLARAGRISSRVPFAAGDSRSSPGPPILNSPTPAGMQGIARSATGLARRARAALPDPPGSRARCSPPESFDAPFGTVKSCEVPTVWESANHAYRQGSGRVQARPRCARGIVSNDRVDGTHGKGGRASANRRTRCTRSTWVPECRMPIADRLLVFGRLARPRAVQSCASAQSCAVAQWLKGAAATTPRNTDNICKHILLHRGPGGRGMTPRETDATARTHTPRGRKDACHSCR